MTVTATKATERPFENIVFLFEVLAERPWRSVRILTCLLLAGLAEGLGVATVLPIIAFTTNGGTDSRLEQFVAGAFAFFGAPVALGSLLVVLVAGIALKSVLVLLAMREVGYAMAEIGTKLRLDVVHAVSQASWLYFVRRPVGSFANAVTQESTRAAALYLSAFRGCAMALQALGYILVAFLVSWPVTLAALAVGLIMFALLRFLVTAARRAGNAQAKHFERLAVHLTDAVAGIKPVKAMGWEGRLVPILEREAEGLNSTARRAVMAAESMRAAQEPFAMIFLSIGLYVALVPLAIDPSIVVMMALLFYRSLTRAGEVQMSYQGLAANYRYFRMIRDKIDEARAAKEVFATRPAQKLSKALELKGVWFSYGESSILRDLNMEVPFGKVTTLVGPSGSGKTTTIDLVCGLLIPDRGDVLVDGVSLRETDVRDWRRQIGYVPQDLMLLHDTILANVTLSDPTLTREDAERALRAAGVWTYVASLPAGMDTVAGERGMTLSGGQRQRIAIARALVRRPRLLILDEATTALDPDTAAEICATLRNLAGETTVLAISHQAALVDMADRVYRFADGAARRSPAPMEIGRAAAG